MRAWMAACFALAACAGAVHAQGVSEPAIKAAFLYKFLGYVEWPQSPPPDSAYVIAIAGGDDVATELERLATGRNVNGHRVTVRRVKEGEGLRGAQMLFVGRGQPNARELLRTVQKQALLTVTEGDRGLELGSIVNLVTLEDRVGFEVSLEAADRAGILISSRMLGVARHVVPKGGAS